MLSLEIFMWESEKYLLSAIDILSIKICYWLMALTFKLSGISIIENYYWLCLRETRVVPI